MTEPSQPNPSLPLMDKTNLSSNLSSTVIIKAEPKSSDIKENCTEPHTEDSPAVSHESQTPQQEQQLMLACDETMNPVCGSCGGNGNGGRWDKSLGVLCQKFVMLFLVTPVSWARNLLH